jgi:DNA invertase Pin-like site-specific DNA recombinase
MTDTLIIDNDGVYNPNDFNDRILLGMKGTMSEAELHFLQERMRGGLLNKAKRGELCSFLPIGYEFDPDGRVIKTNNLEIREAVEQLFRVFRTIKTASGVVRYYQEHHMTVPVRLRTRGHSR